MQIKRTIICFKILFGGELNRLDTKCSNELSEPHKKLRVIDVAIP